MRKFYLISILFLISINVNSQEKLSSIDKSQIPTECRYSGDLISCSYWLDSLGSNFLILSQSKIIKPKEAIEASKDYELLNINGRIDTVYNMDAFNKEKELYAYHYIRKNDTLSLLWKLFDFERNCPFDLTLEYLNDNPLITDLNHDGRCESWIIYWLGCRSDVSALDMKLIMHEGQSKYAIRGTRKVRYGGPNDIDGGIMKKDKSFVTLPKSIVDFAIILWKRYDSEN